MPTRSFVAASAGLPQPTPAGHFPHPCPPSPGPAAPAGSGLPDVDPGSGGPGGWVGSHLLNYTRWLLETLVEVPLGVASKGVNLLSR